MAERLQQAIDFRDESNALYAVLSPLREVDYQAATQFREWTFNDILGHLHFWNHAALLSLTDEAALLEMLQQVARAMQGWGLRDFENQWLAGLAGRKLRDAWHELYLETAKQFAAADPKRRVKWAGPDMSVRSSITARLMETWAHGQAAYDRLGIRRLNTDRIHGIAVLGVNTFAWTFRNRGLEVPEPAPHVRLTAPSGAVWEWNAPNESGAVEGVAEEFCQVVTQTRSVADTHLLVTGSVAEQWMRMAQCFAGPPVEPPVRGSRFIMSYPGQQG